MKICSRCKANKEDSEFRIKHDKRVGKERSYLNNTCKKCDSEISTATYYSKKHDLEFMKKWAKKTRDYNSKNREIIRQKQKVKRQTPEYKEMMRKYRAKNKEKIHKQEVITKKRYHEKNRDGITDKYVIGQLASQEILDRETIKKYPEIIEAKRIQLLISRKTKNNRNYGN